MRKNFVLDTNVLLHDAGCLNAFEDNVVNIPIYVIEEMDTFKRNQTELGRNARSVARELDRYRRKGSLEEGVELDGGGLLRVQLQGRPLPPGFSVSHTMDNSILSVALHLSHTEPDVPLIFVTKDTNLRIRADALGIESEDYDREGMDVSEVYTGTQEAVIDGDVIDRLYDGAHIGLDSLDLTEVHANQYLTLVGGSGRRQNVLARVSEGKVVALQRMRRPVWGVKPRNREQHFALDMLLRPEIKLCTLIGKAGTGKTLMALAAGLEGVVTDNTYRRLLVSRPIFPMGRDLGYLPGDVNDKLGPWMQPIKDNFEFLTTVNNGSDVRTYDGLLNDGLVELEALTYIRGRSLPQQFIIVDEAQNLTPHEIKTVLTRVGQDTKIIFTGDPYQIDQPYLDSVNNGLTFVVEKFKKSELAAHVTLSKGERSPLAELAANLL
ncbi:MAG TPA: phosphate starvation-inducible protein PhoH [Myxococcales bacterium]|nr:phosphate starvation-inducible protein PhoH [Myxococcales bacterium]HAN30787.1 phosphate starvation-inducible protein PhoH [Myxococcales bacterium]